jgi:hypothetical protein
VAGAEIKLRLTRASSLVFVLVKSCWAPAEKTVGLLSEKIEIMRGAKPYQKLLGAQIFFGSPP